MTHAEKLARIKTLMESPDVVELDALIAEVDEYEKIHFPIDPPTLPESMKFRRDQMNESQREISLRAGMSLERWQLLEMGMSGPSIDDARRLYAIGIPASVLLGSNNRPVD